MLATVVLSGELTHVGKLTRGHEMIKSRRKLKSMKVKGKVYDPMPHNPTCAPRVRSHDARAAYARPNSIQVEPMARRSRVLKSGTRRVIY
jgi:hypothetical protein